MSLALFDLDETLINGDSASLWSAYMVDQGWVADKQAFLSQEAELMRQYAVGEMSMSQYMDCTLQPLRGRTESEVSLKVHQFITDIILPRVYPQARETLRYHQQQGDRIVIISATGEHLVAPIARALGVNECLAIQIEIEDGRYTGATEGVMTYREGKVARLLTLLNQENSQLQQASFYSDSHNDLPLLTLVGRPHIINPDPILLQYATQAGWPVYQWH
jgi:HAD superfamily hydrolase (TIGR01490 family)